MNWHVYQNNLSLQTSSKRYNGNSAPAVLYKSYYQYCNRPLSSAMMSRVDEAEMNSPGDYESFPQHVPQFKAAGSTDVVFVSSHLSSPDTRRESIYVYCDKSSRFSWTAEGNQ